MAPVIAGLAVGMYKIVTNPQAIVGGVAASVLVAPVIAGLAVGMYKIVTNPQAIVGGVAASVLVAPVIAGLAVGMYKMCNGIEYYLRPTRFKYLGLLCFYYYVQCKYWKTFFLKSDHLNIASI